MRLYIMRNIEQEIYEVMPTPCIIPTHNNGNHVITSSTKRQNIEQT